MGNPVPASGRWPNKIMLLGEAPGAIEERLRQPFVGKAGQFLTQTLTDLGINREDLYITNVVKERPPNNRKPTKAEIEQWAPELEEELKIVNPVLVVCLGTVAAQHLLGLAIPITKLRGRLCNSGKGYLILPTFHPMYVSRTPQKLNIWTKDLEIIKGYL